MDQALAVRAWHRWIDLRDNRSRDAQDRGREVDGHAEAYKAPSIRRGNLKQRHVDRKPSARQKSRHLLQRDGYVVQLAAARQTALDGGRVKNQIWQREMHKDARL